MSINQKPLIKKHGGQWLVWSYNRDRYIVCCELSQAIDKVREVYESRTRFYNGY